MSMPVCSLHRYPIKGLSAESLPRVTLTAGRGVPHDRRYALARAATAFDAVNPEWLSKKHFFMLMKDERLALLHTRFDEHSGVFTIARDGRALLAACLDDAVGRAALEAFFAGFLSDDPDGPPKLVEAPGHTFADASRRPHATTDQYVSLINLASVRALETAAGVALDPLRFRGNVGFEGGVPWLEREWIGSELTVGGARLRVLSGITRCPATSVNPASAERDIDIPRLLLTEFGHNHLGIYCEVVADGMVAVGDAVLPPSGSAGTITP